MKTDRELLLEMLNALHDVSNFEEGYELTYRRFIDARDELRRRIENGEKPT